MALVPIVGVRKRLERAMIDAAQMQVLTSEEKREKKDKRKKGSRTKSICDT